MRLNFHDNVKATGRAAVRAGVAAPGNANARARLRTGRNSHVKRFNAWHTAFAATILAHRSKLAGAAAALARDLESHFPANLRYLAGATARRTGFLVTGLDA